MPGSIASVPGSIATTIYNSARHDRMTVRDHARRDHARPCTNPEDKAEERTRTRTNDEGRDDEQDKYVCTHCLELVVIIP